MKNRTLKISKEDYLEAILVCIKKYGACRVTDVADQLGHSKASVSVALSKLENEGLVVKDDWRVLLSDTGKAVAAIILGLPLGRALSLFLGKKVNGIDMVSSLKSNE